MESTETSCGLAHRVSRANKFTGWHTILVHSRSELRVKNWIEEELQHHSGAGLEDFLIPTLKHSVLRGNQAVEESKPVRVIFVKVKPATLNGMLANFSAALKRKVGIILISEVTDLKVYKMVRSMDNTTEVYKPGDKIVLKSAPDGLEYDIVDVGAKEVTISAFIFGETVYDKKLISEIARVEKTH